MNEKVEVLTKDFVENMKIIMKAWALDTVAHKEALTPVAE